MSASISRAALSPAMATNASCSPRRSIDNSSMPAPPSINAFRSGSIPPGGSSNCQIAVDLGGVLRQRPAPGAVGAAGLQPHLRPQPVARLGDQALEADLAIGDDRDPLAQPLGMVDDVGGEDHRGAGRGLVADQMLEPPLVDRIEAGKGLVEHDQLRLVDDRAEQLDGLRHALRQALDRLVDIVAEPVLLQEDGGALAADLERQAPQRAHEGDRLAGGHRRIEAALLRQIADDLRRFERPLMAQETAPALIGLDDPEQHAQGGGFPRAIRPQDAVYAPFGNGDVDAADRGLAVE